MWVKGYGNFAMAMMNVPLTYIFWVGVYLNTPRGPVR